MALFYLRILCVYLVQHSSIYAINTEMQNSGSGENEVIGNEGEVRTTFTSITSLENQMEEKIIFSTPPTSEITGSAEIESSILDIDQNTYTTSNGTAMSGLGELNSNHMENNFTSSEITLSIASERDGVANDSKPLIENIKVDFINKSCADISWYYRREVNYFQVTVNENPAKNVTSTNSTGIHKTNTCNVRRGKLVTVCFRIFNGKSVREQKKLIFTEPPKPRIIKYSQSNATLNWKRNGGRVTFFELMMMSNLSRWNDKIETNETKYVLNNTIPGDTIHASIRAVTYYRKNNTGCLYSEYETYEFTVEPVAPRSVKTIFINSTCLEVYWNSGNVCRDSYILDVNGKSSNISVTNGCEIKNYSELICNLKPDENQNISIQSFSNGIEKKATRICPARCDINASNITSSSITISCGNRNLLKRTTYFIDVDGKTENFSNLPRVIHQLLPATDHQISVQIEADKCNSTRSFVTIRTLNAESEEVRNLTYDFIKENMTIKVSWLEPEIPNGNITEYRVELADDKAFKSTTNLYGYVTQFVVQYDKLYTVKVTPINGAGDGKTREITVKIPDGKSGKVQNLTLKFIKENMTITVSWLEPNQTNGNIHIYRVELVDDLNSKLNVTTLHTHFSVQYDCRIINNWNGLNSFMDSGKTYRVRITPVNGAGDGLSTNESILIADGFSRPVQNLTLEFKNKDMMLMVDWKEPVETKGNVSEYRVHLNDVTNSISNVTLSNGFHTQFPVDYGVSYNVTVTPVNRAGSGEPKSETIKIPDGKSGTVKDLKHTFKKENMTLIVNWSEPDKPNGDITEYIVELVDNLTSHQENSTLEDGYRTHFKVQNGKSYTVKVTPVNGAGAGLSLTKAIKIPDGESGQVENLNTTFYQTKMTLNVTWDEPLKTNGKITGYKVELLNMTDGKKEINETSTKDIEFTVMHGSCYNISVTPVNEAGEGQSTNRVIRIPDGLPGAVRDLTVKQTTSKYAMLHWNAPIVSNGTIIHYYINGSGRPDHMVHAKLSCDSTCNQHCEGGNGFIQTNNTINVFTKNQNVLNVNLTLLAYTNYTITVQPSTGAGGGQTEIVYFRTSEDVPTKPTNLHVENVTASSLLVMWDKPVRYNGNTSFYVHVRHELDTVTKRFSCHYKVHKCFVNDLIAFWNYTLKVVASNSAGNITSSPFHVKTEPKPPGKVQKVRVILSKPRIVEIYWDQPALKERNGEIHRYVIRYHYRYDKELINETSMVNETLERRSLTIAVHPEVDFSFTIKAVNQAGQGQGITKIRKIPAFLLPKPLEITPMIRKSYNHPVTDSKRQISIELPLLFLCNDSYGSIQQSGIIATRDMDNNGEDPLEQTDPRFHPKWSESINSKSILSYRVTDSAWNSYCILRDKGATRSKTVDYVVGADRNCENKYDGHCNGYLAPETIYRFKVFVCTTAGCTYSDYSKQMATEAEESSHLLAICIIALLIIIVSAVFGYIVYRKRSRRGMGKDESKNKEAHAVEMCVEASRNRPVKLASFDQHVAKLHQDSNLGFSEEYKAIKRLSNKYSTKAAERESCRIKNRYTNVLPYDQTRVKLLPVDDEDGSEYINANFLPGYNSKREYIAAQGPLPATLDDFWRMIWEHHVTVVVMLTQCSEKGTTKCERYWPETNEPIYFGDLIVRMRSESVLPDYVIRIIDVQLGIKKRTIKQFHFLKWPDFGCPEKTWLLLNFVTAVRSHISNSQNGPILVHCSAGVGRTGTFVAVDILLQKIRETDEVDIFNLVLEMRENRPLMVQTENQYIYVHDCIRDALMEDTDDEESISEPLYENQINCRNVEMYVSRDARNKERGSYSSEAFNKGLI